MSTDSTSTLHSTSTNESTFTAKSTPSNACWMLVHGTDVRPTRPRPRARVVLLHGWLQDHTAWLPTALALRDLYGHSTLLLDFFSHGHTRATCPTDATPAG